MDIIDLAKKCGAIEYLNNEYPTYLNHHIKFNEKSLDEFSKKLTENKDNELQTLRAKVASADVLVEALQRIKGWMMVRVDKQSLAYIDKALATYDKLSEVKHEAT